MGKIMRINMTESKVTIEEPSKEYRGLGGRALTSKIVSMEVPPKTDPLGKENKLILSAGILAGTTVINNSRLSVGGKSPLTNTIKEANSGGSAAQKLAKLGLQTAATSGQAGGNMEGKEVRFGIANSALFATVTTNASCGAINGWHDSFTPIGGMVPLFNIMTGEVIFGGVGAGLYGILLYCILAVFIAGLMVGRTPEYLGKKIEQKEVKMAMLAVIATAFSILVFTAISSVITFPAKGYWNPPGAATANMNNNGPHGFSEILYAYTSGTGNNGSAFGGINANTPWYNLTIGLAMLIGRFLFLIPLLAAAGSLAAKKKIPITSGTFPTHGPLFVGLLVGTVIIVGALTFFPALSLGPIVEHYLMHSGKLFSMILLPLWS